MAYALAQKNHGIDQDLRLEIFAGLFLVSAISAAHCADYFRSSQVGGQIAAAMRRADFQSGEAIQGAVENEMREAESRFERHADDILEVAAPLQTSLLDCVRDVVRMHEDHYAELLNLSPERIILRC